MDIGGDDHVVDQNCVDTDTDHNEKTLESQCKQALEVVRADAAPFSVCHRGYGNWCNAHGAVNFNHSAVENDRDENGHNLEAKTDNQRFNGQAEQFSDAHCLHSRSHRFYG